jgi:hypothetical protein
MTKDGNNTTPSEWLENYHHSYGSLFRVVVPLVGGATTWGISTWGIHTATSVESPSNTAQQSAHNISNTDALMVGGIIGGSVAVGLVVTFLGSLVRGGLRNLRDDLYQNDIFDYDPNTGAGALNRMAENMDILAMQEFGIAPKGTLEYKKRQDDLFLSV